MKAQIEIKNKIKGRLCLIIGLLMYTTWISAQTLTIATAANFRDAMTEIATLYMNDNPSIKVKPLFGSSGSLFQQITHKAPFDIYFSANMKYPKALFENDKCYEAPTVYAVGQLVVWSKSVDVSKKGFAILAQTEIKKVSYANPALAPYGKGAIEALKSQGVYEKVAPKLVKAENIAQTAQFAVTGNTTAGIIAKSQLLMPAIKDKGFWTLVPIDTYSPIRQGCVRIKREGNDVATKAFMAFMTTEKVLKIIDKYGYAIE